MYIWLHIHDVLNLNRYMCVCPHPQRNTVATPPAGGRADRGAGVGLGRETLSPSSAGQQRPIRALFSERFCS